MLYFILGVLLGALFYIIFSYTNFFAKIKVDYSIKAKENFKPDMPGQYAVYVRPNIFSKWHEKQTYASLDSAKWEAEKLKKKLQLPKYY